MTEFDANAMPSDAGADHQPAPTAAGEDPLLALLIQLLKLSSLISAPMKVGVCDPAEVSTNEVKVLMALAGEGPLAGHDLVEIMGTPPMNVSRALAALKARGWVEEAQDPENRRRRPVRLTIEGEGAYARLLPHVARVAGALLGKLTQRQQREMAHLVGLVLGRMAEWGPPEKD
ncbi:MAG TPA: MarR family transcriptional regulator [Novosphingobium sp.]|nr:MarR family transcriptional regulator [Novosphingobium sp.]